MPQINKYTDKSAYGADVNRDRTRSALSQIEQDGAMIYDGVNVVVGKNAAAVGDLVVYDKADKVVKFIKGATIVKAQIPTALVPLAVVYARKGERVLVVSLDNATYNGSASIRWGASYEVALSGFNLAAGGSFTIKIYNTDYTFTYAAGTTLTQIAAQINAEATIRATYGWEATADEVNSCIIMTSNTWSPAYSTIEAISGCTIRRTPENIAYQVMRTGKLVSNGRESIRRNNASITEKAGCSLEKFTQYYSIHGSDQTGQSAGSAEIVRESAFTMHGNPDLAAAYNTYKDYLAGEHMAQYPSAFGAFLRDGKSDTNLIGNLQFVDIRGKYITCYPAVAAALDYGIKIEGGRTGLEPGAWWLPSVEEMYVLMHDRVIASANLDSDLVNHTLSLLNKSNLHAGDYAMYTSSEYHDNASFCYYGYDGTLSCQAYKYTLCSARPVSSL